MMRPYYEQPQRNEGSQQYTMSMGGPARLGIAARRIILACIAVFVLKLILVSQASTIHIRFDELFAFSPTSRLGTPYVWQYVTYIFIHDGFMHILFNLLFFYFVAGLVEKHMGTRRFLWLFFLSGIAGAVAQQLIFPDSSTVGASAAVMGVGAACAMLYPDMQVLFLFVIPMKMKHLLWILVAFDIYGASAASATGRNVAYFAHLAGLGAGYLFVKFQSAVSGRANMLYYRLRGRFRGFTGSKATHIDDDQKYREEVDRLLDKIFKEGTQSLTQAESDFLKRQSDKYKKQV